MLLLFEVALIAQEQSKPTFKRNWGVPASPLSCEDNQAHMENVTTLMSEQPSTNGVVILIARLGKGEERRELNYRRAFNVSERYKAVLGVPAEKIIVAEGERVNGFGRVEIYWNGEMIGALPVKKNSDICVECCGDDTNHYYPEKASLEKKRKSKRRRGYRAFSLNLRS